jgi:hypothetical protein
MKEAVLIGEADDPLLYLERLAYVEALRGAYAITGRTVVTRSWSDRMSACCRSAL